MLIEHEGNIRELIRKNDIAVLDVIYDQLGMDVQYCQLYARLAQMHRKTQKPLHRLLQERQEQLIKML